VSTLKTNNAQIGQSATATNNFTLYQPASPDGTVRLGVGNSGATTADAITVTNAGNATLLGNLTVSGTGTSTFAGTLNATTALQSGGVAAERIVQGTAQATTSGTAVGFTGIPSWVKRITVQSSGVTTSADLAVIQLGSGSYVTSGYTGGWTQSSTSGNSSLVVSSTGVLGAANSAANGFMVCALTDVSANKWAISGNMTTAANGNLISSGSVALSGALDRIRITVPTGNFTAGTINIIYEG
jgi:hypothetical protein